MPDILYNWNSLLASVLYLFLLASLHCWIFSNFFQNHCNITDGKLKGVGGGRGEGQVKGGWKAGSGLNLPLGLFRLAMSPRSASHRPKHA